MAQQDSKRVSRMAAENGNGGGSSTDGHKQASGQRRDAGEGRAIAAAPAWTGMPDRVPAGRMAVLGRRTLPAPDRTPGRGSITGRATTKASSTLCMTRIWQRQ